MGKEIVRDTKGRFAELPWKRWERNTIIGIMVFGTLVIGGGLLTNDYAFVERWFVPLEYVAVAEAAELTPDKIEEMKSDVLNRLAKCENEAHKPIVFDSNGKASVGDFQWQISSVQHYVQKRDGIKITEKDAVLLALDEVEARNLAAWVIFETENGVEKDWVNCNKWNQLQTLVNFIKKHI